MKFEWDTRTRTWVGYLFIFGGFFALVINLFETPWFYIPFFGIGIALIAYNLIRYGQLRDYYWLWCMETDEFFGPFNNDIEMKLFQPPHYLPGGWQIFWIPAKDPLKATIIIRKWVRDAEKVLRKDPEYKDRMPR
ncbi:hypothetical protein B1773_00305 [Dehalococcoides mccartyi]|jgi:hypothetical protein|uniref:hypothetical protein n=1 Tax=Dehalococcoides mccartyi TaxID=61435 RepID=UPI00098ECB59|nr:hypothetical protein [Dehalococcoides mccartyi]AQU02541.1 hypothetical protein B1773_00305 [Dehalococcoides mccartyi]AQU05195.1 hypothetical protein B1777_00305 [Dehalococcoides mccartyi]